MEMMKLSLLSVKGDVWSWGVAAEVRSEALHDPDH